MKKTLVIGLGNDQRGDDAAGLLVARRLRDLELPGVTIAEVQSDATLLIDLWAGAERVYLVDAVASAAPPGRLYRFDALRQFSAAKLYCSTHGLGVEAVIELSRALNRLPRELMIYGIQGAEFCVGAAVSPQVQRGVEAAVASILKDLGPNEGTHDHA